LARRHGWGGSPPADEAEARLRIIEAAMRCVDRVGPERFNLAEVAADLGVIRQTVYRYYASTDELFDAVGRHAVESYVDELTAHLRRHKDPSRWVVEALATTIEWIPARPYLTLMLAAGHAERFAEGITSPVSIDIGREIFERSPIDWSAAGYDPRDVDDLIELMLRIMGSMITNPTDPPRSPRELRRVLRAWIGPR
jgi:AcrR family transcriptional regulator